eukprot:6490978-Amphidinium_carterae.1
MLTPESVMSLAMPHLPGACKIKATINQQCPETAQLWEDSLSQIKAAWKAEWESENVEKSKKEKSEGTSFQMCLSSDDECAITISKKAKGFAFKRSVRSAGATLAIGAGSLDPSHTA